MLDYQSEGHGIDTQPADGVLIFSLKENLCFHLSIKSLFFGFFGFVVVEIL